MPQTDAIIKLLNHVLQLGPEYGTLTAETPLFGAMPEFDSMAVVAVITALEESFDITISDDDISAELFATVGSLADFIRQRESRDT